MEQIKGGRAKEQILKINRDSDRPYYVQLADILCRYILDGRYRPGEKLPTENRLTEMFSVSPMTARRAIRILASEGIVTSVRGSGTFVKQVDISSANFLIQDFKELFNDHPNTRIKLLEVCFERADKHIAQKLNIEQNERVIFIRRLLLNKDEPVFYHRGYLISDPHRPIVEAELEATDLKGLFQGLSNGLIKYGDLCMRATLLTETETAILNIDPPSAGMKFEHVFYDFDDKPIGWGWFVSAPSHMHLHTRIGIENIDWRDNERI